MTSFRRKGSVIPVIAEASNLLFPTIRGDVGTVQKFIGSLHEIFFIVIPEKNLHVQVGKLTRKILVGETALGAE